LAQFHALYECHAQARKYEDYRTGVIASIVANFGFCHPKEWLSPSDIMPSLRDKTGIAQAPVSAKDQLNSLRAALRSMATTKIPAQKVKNDGE
jgi:hypothetical protein